MAAQNELLAEAILEDKLVVLMLFQQLVYKPVENISLVDKLLEQHYHDKYVHFGPPSWMFTFVYYACAATTIRQQIASVRRT
jgi:hypothetical protein